jgi:parvulin-like peptidyl-prolyl isomerase
MAEMKKGASFTDLAKKYSEDLATKESGGQINPYLTGVYGDEFDRSVKDARPGVPLIVKDGSGNLHLLLVDGVVKTDFAKVRSEIEKELRERPVLHDEKSYYVKKLRDSAQVEY